MANAYFKFKEFMVRQQHAAMKVGTDGVLLGAWCFQHSGSATRVSGSSIRMLDVGTGTGLIALMLAQRFPGADIHALEIDELACRDAAGNFETSAWADRLTLIRSSFQDYGSGCTVGYDRIVSNPPYFVNSLKPPLSGRAQARHTDTLSYPELLDGVVRLLDTDGVFAVILPYEESRLFLELARKYRLVCVRRLNVYPTPDAEIKRVLMEFRFEGTMPRSGFVPEESSLIIESEGRHGYSEDYKTLTRDFYLNF